MDRVVRCLDEVWTSIEDVCSELSAADWDAPTDLPGWSVRDQLAHLCGIESMLLGREQPSPLPEPWPDHVKNPLGAMNEAQIVARRSGAPEDVLTEFMELTAERLKTLAELTDAELAANVTGVLGTAPLRDVLAIRLVDSHYHEQDIRRAVGKPGGMDGDAAALVVERMALGLPMVVGKRAAAPEGSAVAFAIEGRAPIVVAVRGGRGAVDPGAEPATTLRTDAETFLCLVGGRWSADRAAGAVTIEGDAELGRRVLGSMNVML